MQVHKMDDAMSVTDLKLFGSSHRGTMLPERDVALLLQRVRKMDPPRAVQSQSRVEEIITPRPSPKPAESVRVEVAAKPARVATRVMASAIPRRVSPAPTKSPLKSPRKSPQISPQRSPQRSLDMSPAQSRASSRGSVASSVGLISEPPTPRARSPARPPPPPPKPADASINWRQVFAETEFKPEDFADVDVEKENTSPHTRREKQEVLFQLLKTYPDESQGQWSMSVPLMELKYEWSRREQFRQEQAQVDAMKAGLKMFLHAIEAINQKIKSPIHLKGWARSATHDMSQYERPLRGLYYMYLRKRQMSPIVELGWIIITSAVMWHLQSVMGGKPRSELDEVHDIPAPAPKNKGFDIGSLAQLAKMFV
jgi:hypothetical protein